MFNFEVFINFDIDLSESYLFRKYYICKVGFIGL